MAEVQTLGTNLEAATSAARVGVGTSDATHLYRNGHDEGGGPVVGGLAPSTLPASAGATQITVTGSGFLSDSIVEANGVALPTTFVSSTKLTAMYDPTVAGTVQFTVRNTDDTESNNSPFVVSA